MDRIIHESLISDSNLAERRKKDREANKERLVWLVKKTRMDGMTAEQLSKLDGIDLKTAVQYLRDIHRDGDWGVHRRKRFVGKDGRNHIFVYYIPPSLPTSFLTEKEKQEIRKQNEIRRARSVKVYEELTARYKERYGESP